MWCGVEEKGEEGQSQIRGGPASIGHWALEHLTSEDRDLEL